MEYMRNRMHSPNIKINEQRLMKILHITFEDKAKAPNGTNKLCYRHIHTDKQDFRILLFCKWRLITVWFTF
jgi:hypothetical protein